MQLMCPLIFFYVLYSNISAVLPSAAGTTTRENDQKTNKKLNEIVFSILSFLMTRRTSKKFDKAYQVRRYTGAIIL